MPFFCKLLFRVKVEDESCWPYLVPGRCYWVTGLRKPRVGDFAVFRNSAVTEQWCVKRVRAVQGTTYEMESTVSWGTRATVDKKWIIGTLIASSTEGVSHTKEHHAGHQ